METTLDTAPRGRPVPLAGTIPRQTPIRRPSIVRRVTGISTRPLEIAATIALLISTIVFIAGNGNLPAFLDSHQTETGVTAMYLGDAARTGEMPGPGPEGEIGLRWRIADGSADWTPDSSPVVADGVVYVATRTTDRSTGVVETRMTAHDLATGVSLWEVPLAGFLSDGTNGGPVVADGRVYVAISKEVWLGEPPATPEAGATPVGVAHMAGALVAFDARTGEEVWSYETARAGNFAPAIAGGLAYVLGEDGTLHAVDAATGVRRWTVSVSADTTRGLAASPAVAGGAVYVADRLGRMHAFDAKTGDERWSALIGGNYPTGAAVAGDTVYVGTFANPPLDPNEPPDPVLPEGAQRFYALDIATGSERWAVFLDTQQQSPLRTTPTVAGETVLVTGVGFDGVQILALNTSDGTKRWSVDAGDNILVPATWSGETVYVGNADSYLYALDLGTGAVKWKAATAGVILTAAYVADGVVVFGSGDGNLYAVGSVVPGTGTPVATAVEGGDISGLPPCEVEPRPALERGPNGYVPPVRGTPRASIASTDETGGERFPISIRWSELPSGEVASPVVSGAIRATIAAMRACARPGYDNHLAAYYSDDYFRRTQVMGSLPYDGYRYLSLTSVDLGDFESAVVLADGRVATVFRYTVGSRNGPVYFGRLVVWVEQDGHWLIDEVAEISDRPVAG